MRKAQIEIAGLVVIIILIIIGMVFVIRFMSKEPIDYKKQFTQAELASNMINTLLKTTSLCNGISMTEVLQNCSMNPAAPVLICKNGQNSCEYFIGTSQQIFTETLEKWNIGYEFKVFNDENTLFTLGQTCIGDKKSKLFPVPTESGILSVKLDICG